MRKPDKNNYHAGCLVHDNICLDEQLKAGCTVDLFICFNCQDLFENEELEEVFNLSTDLTRLFYVLSKNSNK